MAQLDLVLDANRRAVDEFLDRAAAVEPVWLVPRAQGKWSPSQLVEHVSRAYEESAKLAAGKPTKFPNMPAPVRWVLRVGFFNRIVRGKGAPAGKTNKAMDPLEGPPTPADGRNRLLTAYAEFDRECRACEARGGRVYSGVFGEISVVDYARFQELHTLHHMKQFPDA